MKTTTTPVHCNEPIACVPIILKDATGTVAIATTVTDSTGLYLFSNVVLGTSTVMETNLPGYTTVSDIDGVPDDSIVVRIGSGSPFDAFRNDFVDELTASVSGTIPEDTDEDGDGDEPIAGVPVALIDADGGVVGTTTTGADGTFVFDGVPPGTYTVLDNTVPF